MKLEKQRPIEETSAARGISRVALAQACGMKERRLARIEAGREGLPGELQDYLTGQGENVGLLASEQAAFLASLRMAHRQKEIP